MEAGGKRTAAVIVRGHMESEKLTELAAGCTHPDLYDLYGRRQPCGCPMVVGPYRSWCATWKICTRSGSWSETATSSIHIGDAVLYLALSRLPAYDYYIMLEHDVDSAGDAQAFIWTSCTPWPPQG
jgi:hypothetical protein